jgi:hypothetical protein
VPSVSVVLGLGLLLQRPHLRVDAVLRQQIGVAPALDDAAPSNTRISSASTTVERRWAMIRLVRLLAISSSSAWIAFSVLVSSAEVASSRMRMAGFFSRVRAIATRCFSPPDSFSPRSPTTVSQPCGRLSMKCRMCAARAASITSSRVASGRP